MIDQFDPENLRMTPERLAAMQAAGDDGVVSHKTTGHYATERDAWEGFDRLVDRHFFEIYKEVVGSVLQPRLGAEDKTLRLDRILLPKKPLLDAGWRYGPIGVEVKRSGEKIGPPLAQLLDYSRAVWESKTKPGFYLVLDFLFLFPVEKQVGTVASIMAQHRVGTVEEKWGRLSFYCGESRVLTFDYKTGKPEIGTTTFGRKTGSR